MKEKQIGSLEMLESRISEIVELYVTGKIDDMQFRALYFQEFQFAYCDREEDIKFAYSAGFYDGNLKTFDNEKDLINESYKKAQAYCEKNEKNKPK